MTPREKAAIRRQRPARKDRCISIDIPQSTCPRSSLVAKLYTLSRLLRAFAADLDHTADTLR
jgi:hypothetical protein